MRRTGNHTRKIFCYPWTSRTPASTTCIRPRMRPRAMELLIPPGDPRSISCQEKPERTLIGKGTISDPAEDPRPEWDREGHDFNRVVKSSKMYPRFSA